MEPPPGVDASKVGVGQWAPGLTFGEFSRRTFDKYYDLAAPGGSGAAA